MAGGNGIAGGLRAPMTSFVGRRQELLDVRVLTSCHRIVTLIGPGGVGKTRLALEAVRAEASDQVIAVDLAAVDGDVANAVLGALDGPVRSNEEPLESVVRFLRSRSLCLVLDNCEHVVEEASAFVERLVQRCPRTTLLATSRVPLRAADEQLYLVPAMSMKGERSEALALYRARADRHAPQRPPDDLTLVAALCHRVDALPLGIELAAALAGTMPLRQLLESLAQGQELLSGGPRSAPSRQGSVDASLRWSVRLLEPAERHALGMLSVFRGTFDLEAAAAVLASEQGRGWTAQVMTRLVGNSLVAVTTGPRGARYRLLETVRAFAAAEFLVDGPAVRDRHLAMLVARAEQIELTFESAGLGMRIAELRDDLPDIRAALASAAAGERPDEGLRLVGALWRFWWAGARAEGRGLVEAALSLPGGSSQARAKAEVAAVLASSAHLDLFGAIGHGEAAVEHARASGNDRLLALAQCWHGWMLGLLDPVAARPALESAIGLARDTGDLTRAGGQPERARRP